MSFDLARALRRLRPERHRDKFVRRPDEALPFVTDVASPGRELLLDTTVYIDVLQGRTPDSVDRMLQLRVINHSSVSLSELTHLFGRLDPQDRRTPSVLREIRGVIAGIPAHRLSAPSVRASGGAGILAGLVARLGGVQRCRAQTTLNDALLYAQAGERGLVVLTRNIREFDFFDQIWPGDCVLFYRTA